jgi:hypothetical protein
MTAFNPIEAARLADSLAAADRDLPDGKWEVWSSNSFRRISGPDGRDDSVLSAVTHRDGHPDLSMNEENLRRLAWLRNNARSASEQLRAAVVEVDRLRSTSLGDALMDYDRLAARVAELERLCERACKVADGLVDIAAPGLDTFRDLGITDIAEIRAALGGKR